MMRSPFLEICHMISGHDFKIHLMKRKAAHEILLYGVSIRVNSLQYEIQEASIMI